MKYIHTLLNFSISNFRLCLLLSFSLGVVIFEGFSVSLIIPLVLGHFEVDFSFLNSIFYYTNDIVSIEKKEHLIFTLIIIAILLRQLFIFLKDYFLGVVQAESLEKFRVKVLRIIFRSRMQVFISKHIGEFTNLAFQATQLSSNLIMVCVNIIFYYLLTLVYLLILFYIAKELSIALIIIALMYQFSLNILNKISMNFGLNVKTNNQNLFNMISDFIKCIKIIKVRNVEEKIITNISSKFNNLTKNNIKFYMLKALIKSISPIILIFLFSILLVSLGLEKKLDPIYLSIIVVLLIRIQQTLTQINSDKASYFNYLPSLDYINDFLSKNKYQQVKLKDINKQLKFEKSIKFVDVSFRYNQESKKKHIHRLSIEIKKNDVTGIFGPSGSGKSTIIELLLMNYKPLSGKITVDNLILDESLITGFRDKIGYVSQENLIFNDTIRYNLSFGNNKVLSEKKIWDILEIVDLKTDFKKYKYKLDYNLGESGNKLSGGQKQRLSLARALLIDPEILILDEPTSSLDKKTERIIIKNINEFRGKKTIILISHSKDIIDICDKNYFIEDGKLK